MKKGLGADHCDYICRCVFGSLIYWVLCCLVTYCSTFFPDIDTGSEMYQNFYYRVMINTTYFPLGSFMSTMGMSVLGWTFVNVVTLKRTDPFTSGN